jgi:predicted Zn-dependent protease
MEMLTAAVRLAPGSPSVRLNMARALISAGRKNEAAPHLEAAASAAPDSERLKREIDEIRRSL